jgi:hypothetical protein
MSFTFSGELDTALDRIRDILGDTDKTSPLRTDARIEAAISYAGSENAAIGWIARSLVAEFAQQPVRVSLTGLSVDYSARIPYWQTLADTYASSATIGGFAFVVAGKRDDGYVIAAESQL